MPLVVIIGRPNVGKSTLFNRLAGSKRALVDNMPGVTRDLHYAEVQFEGKPFTLVDSGGIALQSTEALKEEIREQVMLALDLADAVIFLMDGRDGLAPDDIDVAAILRKRGLPTFLAVNKIDGPRQDGLVADFYALGADHIFPVSALEKIGLQALFRAVTKDFPKPEPKPVPLDEDDPDARLLAEASKPLKVAFIGRPNVGKSSLVNRVLGEPRMIVSPIPGTTMDAIDTPCTIDGRQYILVDTAGLRRKSKVHSRIESYAAIKALQALDRADVACLLLDANEKLAEQDLRIATYAFERGCGLILALNKSDLADSPNQAMKRFEEYADFKIPHFNYIPRVHLSALTGKGVGKLFDAIGQVADGVDTRISTADLNRLLEKAVEKHAPVDKRGNSFKVRYATQVAVRPPAFVVFTNSERGPHFSWERYLVNRLRDTYKFVGSPIRVFFRNQSTDRKKPGRKG